MTNEAKIDDAMDVENKGEGKMHYKGVEIPYWAKWIAKDKNGEVYVFSEMPFRDDSDEYFFYESGDATEVFGIDIPGPWEDSLRKINQQHEVSDSQFTTRTAPSFLSAAKGHMEDRASTYDKPEGERSMEKTVQIFNAFHGFTLTEAQGWHFMQILKDVRLFARSGLHVDSAEDCCAYAALKAEAKAKS